MAGDVKEVSKEEVKYREVVWELFQEEVKYLTTKLQPLELVNHLLLFHDHFSLSVSHFLNVTVFVTVVGIQRIFRGIEISWISS